MKASIERWLTQRWYGGIAPGLGLRSLAGAYRLLSQASQRPAVVERLPVPVLVIGNFTAGGTGKTPLAIALANFLKGRGMKPGIVSRGHGRQSSVPIRVLADTPVDICGDEPRLMFEKTGLPVFVDRDRVAAARAAVGAGCNLIIADDGLQHRRLGRDLEIEVVDGERRYGNGLLLPAGPLRETPRTCDFRVINGRAEKDGDWSMQMQLGCALALNDSKMSQPLSHFSGSPVHAFAGIGNPRRFFSALRNVGVEPIEHAFEDHHQFRTSNFSGLIGPILMTEKDAVKCRSLGLSDAWAIPVEAELPLEFFTAIEAKLEERHARP